ncbi:hypothetical protein [Spirosoma oryzicola]|uniref:hypothetical protein n=1 Tax=Spirosoma oryzicola TaxID=2898794 RepID=UPI001E2D5852|nr:hypothetical protein [Spirosoma oryzicola]UHG93937.1 hypothetical protein LQ777_24540 [Spirosoma oryzicola]
MEKQIRMYFPTTNGAASVANAGSSDRTGDDVETSDDLGVGADVEDDAGFDNDTDDQAGSAEMGTKTVSGTKLAPGSNEESTSD